MSVASRMRRCRRHPVGTTADDRAAAARAVVTRSSGGGAGAIISMTISLLPLLLLSLSCHHCWGGGGSMAAARAFRPRARRPAFAAPSAVSSICAGYSAFASPGVTTGGERGGTWGGARRYPPGPTRVGGGPSSRGGGGGGGVFVIGGAAASASSPSPLSLSSSPTSSSSSPSSPSTGGGSGGDQIEGSGAGGGSRAAIDWVASQPLETLLPKADALSICRELLGDESLLNEAESLVASNWESLERRLRDESRTVREILGGDVTKRILDAVRDLGDEGGGGSYDSDAVRAFLGSDAVNDLFAKVLYDGIYEFFQKIDVFGNIIGTLPIIGPIRNQIQRETKKSLDRTLGPLVKAFLGTYTKIAVGQAADFVLSPENRRAFGSANANLVESVLDRPVNALLPTTGGQGGGVGVDPAKLRGEAFDALRDADVGADDDGDGDVAKFLDWAYDLVGDKSVRDAVVDVDAVLDASPTLRGTVDRLWDTAVLEASSGGGGDGAPPSS